MHFSWEKHLELYRNVAVASEKNQGMALALMGVALTMLATDLLAHELKASVLPSSSAGFRESPSRLHCCRLPSIESRGRKAER